MKKLNNNVRFHLKGEARNYGHVFSVWFPRKATNKAKNNLKCGNVRNAF